MPDHRLSSQRPVDRAARRVGVFQAHLSGGYMVDDLDGAVRDEALACAIAGVPYTPPPAQPPLAMHATAATDLVDGNTVMLPEHLGSDESWDVRRNAMSPMKFVTSFAPPDNHVATLHDNLETSISRYPKRPCLGTRISNPSGIPGPYTWQTYSELGAQRTALGSGLLHFGISPRDKVGLYSANCAPWVAMESACNAYNMPTVPLYDTLGPDAVQYICNHAELAAVAVSAACLPTLLQCLPNCPSVKLVVVYPHWGAPPGPAPAAPTVGVQVVTVDDLEAAGRAHLRPFVPPAPEDMATISYTSGTTGVPKGVVLSHANLIANAAGNAASIKLLPSDVHVSYLPLAHIYERVNLVSCLHAGAALGFYRGDVLGLLDDIVELGPTIFCSVPRLWNRIHDRVRAAVAEGSAPARALFDLAYRSKSTAIAAGDPAGGAMAGVWDRVVFSKVRAKIGGKVRLMATGASPISSEVIEFIRVCFGTIIEGYGMTETACLICSTSPEDTSVGHVGTPSPACEVKLQSIPEMNYLTSDKPYPRGEVCVRGPIVFKGYYKDEINTRDAIDSNGWLHTGDVGCWLPGGRLKIIDRKKNIFKLAQGEYIAPEKIENVYARHPLVLQCFVHGDSLKPQLVAIVVPDPETLVPWAKAKGLGGGVEALCREPQVVEALLQGMRKEGKSAGLKGFEQVAAIHVVPEPFSVENGMLTPTFKLKRPQAKTAFQGAIDDMYARLES